MPKLYVANATQQIQQFTYWLTGMPRHFMQEIPQGSQIQVGQRDLPREEIDYVLGQHRRYGLRSATEAQRDLSFSGLCYSVDKPVALPLLYELVEHRTRILTEQGKRSREAAAIATDEQIAETFMQNQVPLRLQNLEMSVEEMTRDQRDQSPEISEGVRVSHRPQEPAPDARRRGQTRAAGRRRASVG
jgi:hypothetical protein